MSMTLSTAQRAQGQSAALRANLLGNVSMLILNGSVMMLFANDVLSFSPKQIGGILAMLPFIGLLAFPLLGPVRRFGLVRSLQTGAMGSVAMVLVLLLLPPSWLTFWVYMAILALEAIAWRLGPGIVWQALLRDVTTDDDRGRFFGRMRFFFTLITAGALLLIPVLVGNTMTYAQYRILLLVAIFGRLNYFYWGGRIPELPREEEVPAAKVSDKARLWALIRTSPLLRIPLLVMFLVMLATFPLYVVYMKKMLHIPSGFVSVFLGCLTVGMALSLLVWGRIADALGFRNMLAGMLLLGMMIVPLHFAILPLPEGTASLAALPMRDYISLALLLVLGIANGVIQAGMGIATTSLAHYHVRSEDSLELMNIWQILMLGAVPIMSLVSGIWLEDVAVQGTQYFFFDNHFHFDWVKGYHLVVAVPVQLMALVACRWLPNARPYMGVADFFSALTPTSMRNLLAHRRVFHESEATRRETAEWFGTHPGPMSIEPLFDLLSDPAYDVKVAAIRSLGRTGSSVAGERLLQWLEDPLRLNVGDHVAWALGELRYQPAYGALVDKLNGNTPLRVRAMAARALGKLGDQRAMPHLRQILEEKQASQHLIASASIALMGLDMQQMPTRDVACTLFSALMRMNAREDRYEVMNNLCEYLDISNLWLLRYLEEHTAYEALCEFVEHQHESWREKRHLACSILRERDLPALQNVLAHQADIGLPVVLGLRDALQPCDEWDSVAVMSCAWLLLHQQAVAA